MKQFTLHRFHSKELHYILSKILSFLKIYINDHADIKVLYDKLLTIFQAYDNAIQKKRSSDYTQEKKQKDEIQDNAFLSWRFYIQSCECSIMHPEWRSTAQRIIEVINRHGWTLHNKNYKNKSSSSISLINEMETEEFSKDLQELLAKEHFNTWKAASDDFQATVEKKINEDASEAGPSATEMRKDVILWISRVIDRINDKCAWEEEGVWKELKAKVDALMTEMTTRAKSRETRNANEQNANNANELTDN